MRLTEKTSLGDVLLNCADFSWKAWLYLPADAPWALEASASVLESTEVPPDMEDDPEAGVPLYARKHNLIQALPISDVQSIVQHRKAAIPEASIDDLLEAFLYYYDNDAFLT